MLVGGETALPRDTGSCPPEHRCSATGLSPAEESAAGKRCREKGQVTSTVTSCYLQDSEKMIGLNYWKKG